MTKTDGAHLPRCDPSLRSRIPPREQETKCVAQPERHAREEGPLLALEPVVILDEIRVGENGVEGEEGDSIQVGVPRQSGVQGHRRYFGGNDLDRAPVPGQTRHFTKRG